MIFQYCTRTQKSTSVSSKISFSNRNIVSHSTLAHSRSFILYWKSSFSPIDWQYTYGTWYLYSKVVVSLRTHLGMVLPLSGRLQLWQEWETTFSFLPFFARRSSNRWHGTGGDGKKYARRKRCADIFTWSDRALKKALCTLVFFSSTVTVGGKKWK